MIEGSGSIPLTSGSGSGRPKSCGSGGSGSATLLEINDNMVCAIDNSDFHNLVGFTSKKMPNNILYNVC
jgi:hypothetical protein